MGEGLESVRSRQLRFLFHCLDRLKAVYDNDEELYEFYQACLTHFQKNKRLSTEDLAKLLDQGVTPRTYKNRWDKLVDALGNHEQRLTQELGQFGLKKFPRIRSRTGGGGSKHTYYFIDVADEDETEDTASKPLAACDREAGTVKYQTKEIKRLPWYFSLSDPFFRHKKRTMGLGLALIAIVYVVIPAILIYISVTNAQKLILVAVPLVMLELWLSFKAYRLLRLITHKITLVDSWGVPFSTVGISEISQILNDGTEERTLTMITVEADCPICAKRYGLKKSIWLEQPGFFGGKIIGVCRNNRSMHRFTFDKDLMEGHRDD